jgi:signal transduction histidine kinase
MRLLNKTITAYFIFSVILLLIAVPALYFTLKKLMVQSVDEQLVTTKTLIIPQLTNNIMNHRENNIVYSGFEIHYEKKEPDNGTDSIYTDEITGPAPNQFSTNRILASHFYINQEFYNLHITTSLADKYALVKRIIWVTAILLIVLLLGLLIMNRVLTKRIWQPFYHTLGRLKNYRVDRQDVLKLEQSPVSEFDDLNHAIESLTASSHQAYQSQKEFIENASHELQTPLAVFQSKLELLMQTKPLNEEQASLIADLAGTSKRMSRLNKDLILLTKIDNDQFLEKESLPVKEILEKLIRQFEFQIKNKSIRLSFLDEQDIRVEANRTLIETMLSNLLSNAIRHNIPNGFIQIALYEKELTIQNSGRTSSLDAQKLFRRFQKDSTDTESIGLGLEIVNKICTLYHYSIQYRFSNQMHLFNVHF